MRYSVVILTFGDRLPALIRCLNKVLAGARTPADDYEIIVVNNGSKQIRIATEGMFDLRRRGMVLKEDAMRPRFQFVHREKNEGVCSRNYGIDIARGDYIIQVDDDVLVAPGFDDVLLKPYENHPDIGATGPHGFYQDSTWGLLIDDRRRPRPGQFCDLVMGYCWSWRNEKCSERCCAPDIARSWDRLPRFLYDWQFSPFWHEETALQMEIRYAGYRIVVTPPVATHHTLHNWAETKADGPITGESIALRNFCRLRSKWKDIDIRYERPLVGLTGPEPGKPAVCP